MGHHRLLCAQIDQVPAQQLLLITQLDAICVQRRHYTVGELQTQLVRVLHMLVDKIGLGFELRLWLWARVTVIKGEIY